MCPESPETGLKSVFRGFSMLYFVSFCDRFKGKNKIISHFQ